jgi:hypothetical protein
MAPFTDPRKAARLQGEPSNGSGIRALWGPEWTRLPPQFPDGCWPPIAIDFDVPCEIGFTVVTVQEDGWLLADPSVGWISLHGVRFKTV